ncbi:MAG: hypothetical protein EP346_05515 [Bacteroidetes bacterium]|nr:MAG: hypothetical protein EP346_05515 [Bacteroidota bacterium]
MRLIAYPKPALLFLTISAMALFLYMSIMLWDDNEPYLLVYTIGMTLTMLALILWAFKFIVIKERRVKVYYLVPFWTKTIDISNIERFRTEWYMGRPLQHKRYKLSSHNGQIVRWRDVYIENWERLESVIHWLKVHPDQSFDDMAKTPSNFEHNRYVRREVMRLRELIVIYACTTLVLLFLLLVFVFGSSVGIAINPKLLMIGMVCLLLGDSLFWLIYCVKKRRKLKQIVVDKDISEETRYWPNAFDE